MGASIKKMCTRRSNLLLEALPYHEKTLVESSMEVVELTAGQVLYEQGEAISLVYFPCSAVISLLTIMQDGEAVEVATVGNEGMVGIPRFLGEKIAIMRGIVQIPGEAIRMDGDVFERKMRTHPVLYRLLRQYAYALLTQIIRSAGCNRLHAVEQRCARWLLTIRDRTDTDVFPLTQESLAEMLGIRRQTAAIVLGDMEKKDLVKASRGKIKILNRQGLESLCCECYQIIREEFGGFLA